MWLVPQRVKNAFVDEGLVNRGPVTVVLDSRDFSSLGEVSPC